MGQVEGTRHAARRAGLAAGIAAAHLGIAILLLRSALEPGTFPGGSRGEAWGRLFVTAQVGRWVRGEAPWLKADLAGWPTPISFWPVDPLIQAVSVPLSALLGDTAALTAVTITLVTLTGLGVTALARTLGASAGRAVAAGLACQLAPYLIRNLTDLVLEVEAAGLLALAAAAMISAARAPDPRRLALAGLAVAALAATSPYYAIYLAMGAAIAAIAQPRRWRESLKLGAVGALACGLVLLPLGLAEGGSSGRLGPQYQGRGYHPTPGALVHASGRPWREALPPEPQGQKHALDELPEDQDGGLKGRKPGEKGAAAGPQQPQWSRLLARTPGGAVALLALCVGLLSRDGRRWALLGLVFYAGSPAPYRLASMFGYPVGDGVGLIQELLQRLPLTNTLGNPMRALTPALILGFSSASLTLSRLRWLGAPLLPLLALAEAALHLPSLGAPATRATGLDQTLRALSGPTMVFPSGDPPAWHPSVYPKEVLFLAGRAGVPVPYDYGRGRTPADLWAQIALARIADTPLGDSALHQVRPQPDEATLWRELPFDQLLVLEDRLNAAQLSALRGWLSAHATLQAEEPGGSVWTRPVIHE